MNSKISLVIPVFNESTEIDNFFSDLKNCNFNLINEIILVDDYSTDNSYELLKKAINEFSVESFKINFILIKNSKNRGYGLSIKKGVNKSNNDSIAIIDLDRTYKIEDLNYIANQFINDYKLEYDLISGQRKIDTTNTSRLKIIGKTIINFITNFCFNEKIIDYNSGLRVFNKSKFTKHSHMMSDRFSLTTSMTITFLNENYEIKFHKIKYDERIGQSKLKFIDFFRFLYTIFSLLFYYKPFKILIPLILPIFLALIIFLIKDIYNGNLTDKTVLLFNFNFLSIILLFIIDRINKLK
ncbi:glycosyltransferase family 2 protein [Candidatus Pelagibacter ubique]|nr:glycosyltransferase family 2 protein [Candidatus Pelagibacter ubique]